MDAHNRFDRTMEAEVVALYQGGTPTLHVARRFGVSDTTVRNILRRNGLVASHLREKVSEAQIDQMLALYHAGKTLKEIADELSVIRGTPCSNGTVSKVLRKAGIPMRPSIKRHKLTPELRQELAGRYAAGEIMAALQKAYGVSSTVVTDCLDEFGIAHRTGWGRFHAPEWTDALGRTWVFKSRWELAYAQHLDARDLAWDYEGRKFGLRECSCYTPDFAVELGGVEEYHEVKGWLDDRTIARMQEFARTYPARHLVLVGPRELVALCLIEAHYADHPQADRVASMREWLENRYRHANTCARVGTR
jgi:transposase